MEQVKRAARWTVINFDRRASVAKIVQDLGWCTLDQIRADAHLCLFYKSVHGLVAVPLPDYIYSTATESLGTVTLHGLQAGLHF